jgi:hypothetical protein
MSQGASRKLSEHYLQVLRPQVTHVADPNDLFGEPPRPLARVNPLARMARMSAGATRSGGGVTVATAQGPGDRAARAGETQGAAAPPRLP